MRVSMLTSWEERCGIADYTRHLVDCLREQVQVDVVPASFQPAPRAVYRAMGVALNAGDVAHVQHSYAFFGGMHPLRSGWGALASAVHRPLLVTVHELDRRLTGAGHLPPVLEQWYKRDFNRRTFCHPAIRHWMVHAAEIREALLNLGAPAERITYVPMPAFPPATTTPDVSTVRDRFKLRDKRALVILGFLARRKGYDVALQALRSLPTEYVLVAAGGEHAADRSGSEAWLRAEAQRLGVADRVRITGFLSDADLEAVTALADAVLAPFREMSASASLSYALARGKAVIASDLPENLGLQCVRLFSNGNATELERAIREVTLSPAQKRLLAEAAARYTALHSYHSLALQTAAVYQRLQAEAGTAGV